MCSFAVAMSNLISYDADEEGHSDDTAVLDVNTSQVDSATGAETDGGFEAWANDPQSVERAERRQQAVRSQRSSAQGQRSAQTSAAASRQLPQASRANADDDEEESM